MYIFVILVDKLVSYCTYGSFTSKKNSQDTFSEEIIHSKFSKNQANEFQSG